MLAKSFLCYVENLPSKKPSLPSKEQQSQEVDNHSIVEFYCLLWKVKNRPGFAQANAQAHAWAVAQAVTQNDVKWEEIGVV